MRYPKPPFNRAGKAGICRWCGKPVQKPARTWHPECLNEYEPISSAGQIRAHLLQRDHGICWCCGRDCEALLRELRRLRSAARRNPDSDWGGTWGHELEADTDFSRRIKELGLTGERTQLGISLWEAHHIQAVSESGPAMSLDDLLTLCWWCHKKETAKLHRRRPRPPAHTT